MAKNIDFMGAVFPDVPSVKLPQQGGGLVAFDDTTDATATADKILSGYTAYAGGQKLTGTASGGITPSGTIQISQNGQVDVTNYATADVNVSGGGGASNVVQGTFTTGSTGGAKESFTIPYTGNGYLISLLVFVKGGVRNNTDGGDINWYNSQNRYDAGLALSAKTQTNTTPTYTGSGGNNVSSCIVLYKNSTTSSGSFTISQSVQTFSYNENISGVSSGYNIFRFASDNTVGYFVGNRTSSTIGLARDTEFEYTAVYSS